MSQSADLQHDLATSLEEYVNAGGPIEDVATAIRRMVIWEVGAMADAHSARADADGISLEQQAAHEALLVGDAALLDA